MEVKKILLAVWLHLCYITLVAQLPTTCENAKEVFCGETYEFDVDPLDSTIDMSTLCQGNSVNALWLSINGTGAIYDFKVCDQSSFEIFLVSGSCENQSCQQLFNSAIIYDCPFTFEARFKSVAGEMYYVLIVLNYLDPRALSFTLQCAEPAVNDECDGSLPISVGMTYEVNALSSSMGIQPSCSFFSESGDLWYEFTGSGDFVSFRSSSNLVNGALYDGFCGDLNCIQQANIGFQGGYLTEPEKIYYLQVRMYGNEKHSFSLQQHEIAPDSYCENASDLPIFEFFEVDFSNVIYTNSPCYGFYRSHKWYSVVGNDSIINITYDQNIPEVLSGDCNSMHCEVITVSNDFISFFAKRGVQYYIVYPAGSNFESYAYITPYDAINDTYETAIQLSCGDSMKGTLVGAFYDLGFPDYLSGSPDLWYRVEGTGRFYEFRSEFLPSSGVYYGPQIELFELVDDQLQPYYAGFWANGIFNYLLSDESVYYIRVSGEADSFAIEVKCINPVGNDECKDAIQISTRDSVSSINQFSTFTAQDTCFNYDHIGEIRSDIWYRFVGNDQLMEFVFNRSVNGASFAIFEGNCQDLNCVYILPAFDYNERHTTRIFFERDYHYFIKIFSGTANSNEQGFQFYFNQISIASNDISCSAHTLNCGDIINDSTTNAILNELDCHGDLPYSPGIWYKVEGNNQYYELSSNYAVENDLSYSLNPTLFSGDCNQLICESNKFYRYQNKWVFYGEKGQTYYIMFNDQIPIKLKFNCFNDLGNDQIFKARKISCGDTYRGYAFNARREDYALCDGRSDLLKDIWFRMTGNDEYVFIDQGNQNQVIGGAVWDVYTKYGIFYKCSRLFDGARAFLSKGQDYYIRVIFSPAQVTNADLDYNLTFTCHPPVQNDNCKTAINLTCNQELIVNTEYATDDVQNLCGESYFGSRNIWFSVDGDNSFKQLDVVRTDGTYPGIQSFIFSGECGQLECLGSGPFFYAESGKKYYFNLGGAAFYGELQITLQCSDGAQNDLCHDALPITCGEQVTGTFNVVTPCDYADPCRDFLYYKRVWYQFTGNGSLVNLKLTTNAYNSHLVRVAVFSGGCCSPEEIRYSYIGDSDFNGSAHKDVYFLSEEGAQYLIAAEQFFITVEDASFDLALTCLDLSDFHLCENAGHLQNDVETDVEVGDYFTGSPYNALSGLVKWKGSGAVDTLTLYGDFSAVPQATFALLPDGRCALRYEISNSVALEIFRDDQKVIYVLPTHAGDEYLIRVSRGPNYSSPEDIVRAVMKMGSATYACALVLPDELQAVTTDQPIILPFDLTDGEYPINVYIKNSDNGPTYFNTFFETGNVELYSDWTGGLKLVEFFNETCRGYSMFNLVFTDLPDHICPDSIYCPDQIIHLGVPLNSNKYQAQFDIKSNARIIQGSQVVYQATQQILLNPGFEVFRGATLEVDLGACREEKPLVQLKSQRE